VLVGLVLFQVGLARGAAEMLLSPASLEPASETKPPVPLLPLRINISGFCLSRCLSHLDPNPSFPQAETECGWEYFKANLEGTGRIPKAEEQDGRKAMLEHAYSS
jgi:hypothetical protein